MLELLLPGARKVPGLKRGWVGGGGEGEWGGGGTCSPAELPYFRSTVETFSSLILKRMFTKNLKILIEGEDSNSYLKINERHFCCVCFQFYFGEI